MNTTTDLRQMTPEEGFHVALDCYGGRLDLNRLSPGFSDGMNAHARRLRNILGQELTHDQYDPKPPPIHFDWVDNQYVNAAATKGLVSDDDYFFIGMFGGTIPFLQVIIDRLLASKQFFPAIGNPSVEADFQPFTALPPNLAMLMSANVHIVPKDPVRQNFVAHLLRTVVDFTFRHELSHILDGHCNYGSSRGLYPRLEVPLPDAAPAGDRRTDHIFELIADSFAMSRGLQELMHVCDLVQAGDHVADGFEALAPFYTERLKAITYWSFAVSLFFRLLSDEEDPYHPPLAIRQARVCLHAEYQIKDQWPALDHEVVCGAVIDGAKASDDAIASLAGKRHMNIDSILQAFRDMEGYEQVLLEHWTSTLKPEFENSGYSFRTLPNWKRTGRGST